MIKIEIVNIHVNKQQKNKTATNLGKLLYLNWVGKTKWLRYKLAVHSIIAGGNTKE